MNATSLSLEIMIECANYNSVVFDATSVQADEIVAIEGQHRTLVGDCPLQHFVVLDAFASFADLLEREHVMHESP
jgi:hypothetical protein